MEIQEIGRIVGQRWRVIVVVILVCLALSLAWTLASPVKYRAQGRIVISTSGSLGTASDAYIGQQVSVERAPTYARLLKGPEVAARASRQVNGSISADTIEASIDARINSRLPLLDVTATSTNAQDAVLMVAAAELGLQQYVSEIERPGRDGSLTGVVLTGDVPTVERLGNPILNAVIAGLAGLVLGTALAAYRDRTDPVVRNAGQLTHTGLTYRGTIDADDEPPVLVQAFQRLAVRCTQGQDPPPGRILVVGVDEGCDSHFIASGLAGALSTFGSTVTLVDAAAPADPVAVGIGLSEVVSGSRPWAECRRHDGSRLKWTMSSGSKAALLNALLVVGPDAKERLLVSSPDEHVLIAGPSLVHSPLGVALTALGDAVLIVARTRGSGTSDVVEARETLAAMDVPCIGFVLLSGTPEGPPAAPQSKQPSLVRIEPNTNGVSNHVEDDSSADSSTTAGPRHSS